MDNIQIDKYCEQCGKQLVGRFDKRFCDDYCRNTFNNKNRRPDEEYIRFVNGIIRRNRRILKTLCPVGKATVRKEVLDAMGYDYKHFSGVYRSKANQPYFLCYDYAMSPITDKNDTKKVLIVQKQEYFDKYQPKLW